MMQRRVGAMLVAASSLVLVCGCASATAPRPAGITDEQRAAVTQQKLDESWGELTEQAWGLTQPEVEIVRYTNWTDTREVFADCVTQAGFETEFKDGWLIGPVVASDQSADYALARYTCMASYPRDPLEYGFLSGPQASYLYNYWSYSLTPCLRSAGFSVPDLPLPDEFGEGYPSIGAGWDPYAYVPFTRGGPTSPQVQQACPPYPRDFYSGDG